MSLRWLDHDLIPNTKDMLPHEVGAAWDNATGIQHQRNRERAQEKRQKESEKREAEKEKLMDREVGHGRRKQY